MKAAYPPRRAFTLIELPVVIAILAALLVPAVTKGLESAKVAHCSNNLKQHGTSFQLWAGDHELQYPFQLPPPIGAGWPGSSAAMASANGDETWNSRTTANASFFIWGLLEEHLSTPRMLHCPSDFIRPYHDSWQTTPGIGILNQWYISYFVAIDRNQFNPGSILSGDRHLGDFQRTGGRPPEHDGFNSMLDVGVYRNN